MSDNTGSRPAGKIKRTAKMTWTLDGGPITITWGFDLSVVTDDDAGPDDLNEH